MSEPTVIYYRYAYSPTTGDVTLAHNHEGHPTDVRFHTDMAEERPENDLSFGFAHKSADNWKVIDDDSRPIDDPNLIYSVVHAVTKEEGKRRLAAKLSYDGGDSKWAWVEGLPVERWSDSEYGDGGDPFEYDSQGNTVRDERGDAVQREDEGIRAHFSVLVELCQRDPQLAEGAQHWEGRSYQQLDYSSVAAYLNESGRKWAIGVEGYDFPIPVGEIDQYGGAESYDYDNGAQVGAHGPTTTKEDVEKAIGERVVDIPDQNSYGLKGEKYQTWDNEDLWSDEDETQPGTQPGTFS